jgi:uridine phosphorylase
MKTFELLNGNPAEPSVFTARDFILTRKRKSGTMGFQFPNFCILGFYPALIQHLRQRYAASAFDWTNRGHPYLLFQYRGVSMGFVYPGIGSPLASAILDETFALGAETCIFIGAAGTLAEGFHLGDVVLPVRAVRDEGTSFHYDAPGRHAFPDSSLVDVVRDALHSKNICFREGTTWTTDGVYREIPSKIRRLREEGCLTVDMEASALFCVAKHYGKKIAGVFLASDSLSGASWKPLPPASNPKAVTPAGLLGVAVESLHRFHSIGNE